MSNAPSNLVFEEGLCSNWKMIKKINPEIIKKIRRSRLNPGKKRKKLKRFKAQKINK